MQWIINKQLECNNNNNNSKKKVPDLFQMDVNTYSAWFPSQEFPT